MKIFELHFNPKARNDLFFDSFVYEPKNSYEKNLGSLFMIGEITNSSYKNSNLLDNLSETIKRKYYSVSFKNPSKAITESLKEANEFLSEEVKKDNSEWMGNLNFSAFSLKDFDLSFTSTGKLKILLIRGNSINDIGENIKSKEIEPYPLKVFFNVVSGKLAENDILLVMTEEMFDFLNEEKMLYKISQKNEIDEKSLKDIFPQKTFTEGKGRNISGLCFIAYLNKENEAQSTPYQGFGKKAKELIFEKPKESFPALFKEKIEELKSIFNKKQSQKRRNDYKKAELEKRFYADKPFKLGFRFPSFNAIKNYFLGQEKKGKLFLLIAFIIILITGALFFKNDERIKKNETKETISKMEEKLEEGKNLIKTGKEKEAESALLEAWNEISTLTKDKKSSFYSEANSLKESIEESLGVVNKIEKISDPEAFISLNPDDIGFTPQNISFSNYNFYFSSQVSKYIYIYNTKAKEGEKIKNSYETDLDEDSSDFVMFFSKPNSISYVQQDELKEGKIIADESYSFRSFSSYNSSLYFLNEDKNEVIKYLYLGSFKWKEPETVLELNAKAKSIAVDGFIWVLNENNEIESYYRGEQKETIALDIFPAVKNLTKIKTRIELAYIYIAEPINNRVIVIDKNGNLIKQFQSEDFDNIKDFSISYNGNTIWLLNGSNVYELKL